MNLDPVKFKRQEKSFDLWRTGKPVQGVIRMAVGIIQAVTGFGKTFILIMAIKYMNKTHPDRTAIVVVPTTKLLQDWMGYTNDKKESIKGHIENHGLFNVRVFVVNTYVKYQDWQCDLLALDECHHYANEDSQYFSTILNITQYKFLMGLSATLSKRQEAFFLKFKIPVVDVIDQQEALKYGYIAPSTVYNLAIPLSDEDKEYNELVNNKFKHFFSRFNHEFDIVKACNGKKGIPISIRLKNGTYLGKKTPEEWIQEWARVNKYNGDKTHPYSPENIVKNAAQCMNLMAQRKDKWQNFPSKIEYAVKIINRFPYKTMCFSETSAFADKIVKRLPDIAIAYHSNLSTVAVRDKEIIEIGNAEEKEDLKQRGYTILGTTRRKKLALQYFTDPSSPIRVLSTVRALDEGVDIPDAQLAIQLAYSSTTRQNVQRNGRVGRLDYANPDKKAITINLYMEGTQEEKWLREKQKNGQAAIWVSSIDEINPQLTIKLSSVNEISIDKSAIIS